MDQAHSSKLLAHCPLCQAIYQASEIKLLGERGATRLFHCTCSACGHAMLAIILEAQGAVSSVGLMTDLEVQDALRFRDMGSVTADECIASHRILEMESREFCKLIMRVGKGDGG